MSAATQNPFQPWLSLAARVAIIVCIGDALLVLIGWTFNIEVFKSLMQPVAMNPATALSFLLLGMSIWVQREETPAHRALWLAYVAAFLVILIAGTRLIGYLGWNLGIDQVLFRSRLKDNVMAPNTAVNFLLLGTAIVLLDLKIGQKRPFYPANVLVIVAGFIALFSITGYLYSALSLYSVRGYIPMALNTALVFATLCFAILCSRPLRQPVRVAIGTTLGGTVARRLIPAAFIVPLLLGWVRIQGERHNVFTSDNGLALVALANIIAFNLLVWWAANVLHVADLRHQKAQEDLGQSEERYRAIMQQSADAIYLVDLETRNILDANPAFERMLGYSPGETLHLTVYDLLDDTRTNVEQRLQNLVDAGTPLHGEREYRRKDGSIVEVESSASVIVYAGRSVACTVIHDITARKRAQRELQEKHRLLQEALDQLKLAQSQLVQSEKLASLGQMVAGVAHEINNPLAFVSNNVAVLERDAAAIAQLVRLYAEGRDLIVQHRAELARQIDELAERIDLNYTIGNFKDLASRSRDGLRRIQQIVKDLRDFARLDQSDIHECDLNEGIESTINIIVGLAKKKQVTIAKELAPLPRITAQPAKINQVVMNLLSNAIDASKENSVVTVRSSASDNTINIEVRDNGQGIPPAVRERIFDPFFTTKPLGQGTGLGLSISYGIIRDHGGKIEVESTEGKGSTFTIKLPMRQT